MIESYVIMGLMVVVIVLLLKLVSKDDGGITQDFMAMLHSSTKKGHLGESIVRLALRQLPANIVHEQFYHPEIQGTPDFAISIGERYLIIDSKFSTEETHMYLHRRGVSLKKYITPGVTFPFVLMWIPDPAYEMLTDKDMESMVTARVIPCTTASLVAIILMTEDFYQVFVQYGDYDEKEKALAPIGRMKEKAEKASDYLIRARKQIADGNKNLKNVADQLRFIL